MQPSIKYFVHTHKKFPFVADSEWVALTGYEHGLNLGSDYICLGDYEKNVRVLLPENFQYSMERVGYLFQTLATDYWILHNVFDTEFVGVTGYRRYAHFSSPANERRHELTAVASDKNLRALTNQNIKRKLIQIMGVFDVIAPRRTPFGCSVATQFIVSTKLPEIWTLFLACLAEVAPEYAAKFEWFEMSFEAHCCGPMGINRLSHFKEYADIYFRVLSLMLSRAENPWDIKDPLAGDLSDRWIGFVAERFYAYFLFVNRLSVYEVPMVFLRAPA